MKLLPSLTLTGGNGSRRWEEEIGETSTQEDHIKEDRNDTSKQSSEPAKEKAKKFKEEKTEKPKEGKPKKPEEEKNEEGISKYSNYGTFLFAHFGKKMVVLCYAPWCPSGNHGL